MKSKFKMVILGILLSVLACVFSPINNIFPTAAFAEEGASTIGGVAIDGLDREEIKGVLEKAIDTWKSEPLIITDGNHTISLNKMVLQFDIERTISTYDSMTQKAWYEFWSGKKTVHLPIYTLEDEELKNEIGEVASWNVEETYAKIMTQASYLGTEEIEAVLMDTKEYETKRIALAIQQIPENAFGAYDIAQILNETIVVPGGEFSFIETMGESAESANREGLNFVASMLYTNVLHLDTEVVERHSQQKVPAYLEPGEEAAIDLSAKKDLKFVNQTGNPMIIKMSIDNQQLKAEVYSVGEETDVTIRTAKEDIVPRTITRYSDDLAVGQVQEVQKGEQGLRVSVYKIIDGVEELVSRDYYPPVNRVLLKSSRQLQTEQPADTDPDLQMDLNGDGMADVGSSDETETGTKGETINETELEVDENGNPILPPGSYYDKGGNLITR